MGSEWVESRYTREMKWFALLSALASCVTFAESFAGRASTDLYALDPFAEHLRHAADLGGDGFNDCPQREVVASLLPHHAHGAFSNLGGKLD